MLCVRGRAGSRSPLLHYLCTTARGEKTQRTSGAAKGSARYDPHALEELQEIVVMPF